MRKIRRQKMNQVLINDRYVFACCHRCREHLKIYKDRVARNDTLTKDKVMMLNLHIKKEENEHQLGTIINRRS